jgi:predicted outer membrane repeat protein
VNIKINFAVSSLVVIQNSNISNGNSTSDSYRGSSGIDAYFSGGVSCDFTVINCDFQGNKKSHLQLLTNNTTSHSNPTVTALIKDSTFNMSGRFGIRIRCLDVDTELEVILIRCTVTDNESWGFHLENVAHTDISESLFINNSGALNLDLRGGQTAVISECTFKNQRITHTVIVHTGNNDNKVILEKSSFLGNHGRDRDCAVLNVKDKGNFTINNVNISDNYCTGIVVQGSSVRIKNSVNLTGNHGLLGGGLKLIESEFLFTLGSKLTIINNTAELYGGGIYSQAGTICFHCLYHFEGDYWSQNDLEVISLSGNSAERGGDAVFGGCLTNCLVKINETYNKIDGCGDASEFWSFASSENTTSQSAFVEDERHVEFCSNNTFQGASCNRSRPISVYRGQKFSIPLIVSDDCCTPSVEMIEAKVTKGSEGTSPLQFEHVVDSVQQARKYCHNFEYTLVGGLGLRAATISFKIWRQSLLSISDAILSVHLKDCPVEYTIDTVSGKCKCNDVLISHKIECHLHKLVIPAKHWVGELRDRSGSMAVQKDCQYCSSKHTVANVTEDSQMLCIHGRTGVMCDACITNYSLQLGGYKCADCSNSTLRGALLIVVFAVVGICLVLLLLGLNLTVSTGMINGLIFYSNMVYLNNNVLLPIASEGSGTHLQNTVRILSTFQAWMNLDFGIITCFFDGYDTYISTWMQFVFSLYIWTLILIIVLASRYSRKISKVTTSNTVPVLATLLLLSYAKILKASIEVFSSMRLQLLDGNMTRLRWKPDANILYLGQLHLPLFLMTLLVVSVYVIPFTLLILLGPLLQAKSHYRLLHWINKLKPFLDALYGPYTRRYRYWPGILLLARVVFLAAYLPNDVSQASYKLSLVIAMVVVLLVMWMVIGRINTISLSEKKYVSCLELFMLSNLMAFNAISMYTTSKLKAQQGLALLMVGSVLVVSCGILCHQIKTIAIRLGILSRLAHQVNQKWQRITPDNCHSAAETEVVTHTLIEVAGGVVSSNELRESLLASKTHEQ